MKKYNKSEIMKRAWNVFRGVEGISFSEALKMAWAFAKKEAHKTEKRLVNKDVTILTIKGWYLRKLSGFQFLVFSSGMETNDFILERESEKAIQVSTEWKGYRKFFWIPKSACEYAFR